MKNFGLRVLYGIMTYSSCHTNDSSLYNYAPAKISLRHTSDLAHVQISLFSTFALSENFGSRPHLHGVIFDQRKQYTLETGQFLENFGQGGGVANEYWNQRVDPAPLFLHLVITYY